MSRRLTAPTNAHKTCPIVFKTGVRFPHSWAFSRQRTECDDTVLPSVGLRCRASKHCVITVLCHQPQPVLNVCELDTDFEYSCNEIPTLVQGGPRLEKFSFTLGTRAGQNPFSGELAAVAYALRFLPRFRHQKVILATSNKAAVLTLRNPRQQSGQDYVRCIYEATGQLRADGNTVSVIWLATSLEDRLLKSAKQEARNASRQDATPPEQFPKMRSTVLGTARAKLRPEKRLPDNVRKHSKKIDTALPGKHTRELYDKRTWTEASILVQLRMDMSRLNESLFRIKAVPSDQCVCGQATETVEHFLLRCAQWTTQRTEILQCTDTQSNNVSFYLGGKTASDRPDWKPDMKAVRATIRFAKATGRLDNT